VLSFAFILLWFVGFITACSWKVNRITPMTAICTGTENIKFNTKKMISVFGKAIYLRLAIRQLVTGRKRYIGSLAVAVILVFFASLVGRMNSWLGSDGKGMMDAFNPADHDIGVQVFGNLTADEAEKIILSYTDITDTYLLAMPGVAVNGIDYTANVISEPERFHIIEGRTCFADNEIVLTEFVAANFGVSIGDIVTVRGDIGSGEYIVSGIYSCANDMGDNVGMSREGYLKIGSDNPHIWCHHYFLADTSKKTAVTQNLEALYGGDVHVHENTWPGLFGIIAAMHALIAFMYGMVIAFILIVTAMTGSKVLSAEQKALGIYKAIGFKTKNLRLTFALRFGLVAVLGSIIGTCLATALTDLLVSAVMKFAGISNFYSSPAPGEIILPSVIVTALFFCFAYVAAGKIKKVNLTELIAKM
jgi:ABC-type antimicrobial peptide transport system permease subunit